MCCKLCLLELFNSLNTSMLKHFSNEHLQNRLHFEVEIEKVKILINHLDLFVLSLSIWNENCIRGSVNIVVRFNVIFVNHVLVVTQITPNSFRLSLLHVLDLLLLHLLLAWLLPFHPFHLPIFHVLLFELLVPNHVHLVASLGFFDHLLLLHHHWVWLHVDRNDKSSKCVSTDHSAVEHNILRSYLNVFTVWVFKLLS